MTGPYHDDDTNHLVAPPLAVILAAGASRRLNPYTLHTPKCLLEVAGKTLLDHQLHALEVCGVREVLLVVGYLREQVENHLTRHHWDLQVRLLDNPHYAETNTAYSLWLARWELSGRDFLYLNGDVLFEPRLTRRLLAAEQDCALAVETKTCGEEEVKVVVSDGQIRRIGKRLHPLACLGEFIGVGRFRGAIAESFLTALEALIAAGGENEYFEAALDTIAPYNALHLCDISDLPVIEIDFPEDLECARREIAPQFGRNEEDDGDNAVRDVPITYT